MNPELAASGVHEQRVYTLGPGQDGIYRCTLPMAVGKKRTSLLLRLERASMEWDETLLQKGNAAVDAEVRMHIESLRTLSTKQLNERFREVCGEESLSSNHTHLFRRVAWQLQANASGGLNRRALERALQLAIEADRELPLPQSLREASLQSGLDPQHHRDQRLPPINQTIERSYRGKQFVVVVRESGFEYNGRLYASLSSVARQITGTRWNGFQFFGLREPWHTDG